MSGFNERLAAAKASPRQSETVSVTLDADLSAEIERLNAAIAAAQASGDGRLSADPTVELQDQLDAVLDAAAGHLVDLKFYRVPGLDWAILTATHPARPEVLFDHRYGYNLHAVVENSAPLAGRLVEDGAEVELTAEQWADLFSVLSGFDAQRICDVVFQLNEWDPSQAVERLKKASASISDSDQRLTSH